MIAATTGHFYEWVGVFLKKHLLDISRINLSVAATRKHFSRYLRLDI